MATILLLQVLAPPILTRDSPTTVGGAAVACHFVGVVVRGGPIVRQLFARRDVAQGREHDLALDPDVGVAGVIGEDHPPPLSHSAIGPMNKPSATGISAGPTRVSTSPSATRSKT